MKNTTKEALKKIAVELLRLILAALSGAVAGGCTLVRYSLV